MLKRLQINTWVTQRSISQLAGDTLSFQSLVSMFYMCWVWGGGGEEGLEQVLFLFLKRQKVRSQLLSDKFPQFILLGECYWPKHASPVPALILSQLPKIRTKLQLDIVLIREHTAKQLPVSVPKVTAYQCCVKWPLHLSYIFHRNVMSWGFNFL